MPRLDVFAQTLRALDAGRGVALAVVTAAHGSTPRHLGARMAVAADGEQWGTIGGGRIEQVVVERAREVAGGAPPAVVRQHLVRDLAMCCGGSMEVVLTPAAPSRAAIAAVASTLRPQVLVTPLDGSPLSVRPPQPGDPRPHQPAIASAALASAGAPSSAVAGPLLAGALLAGALIERLGAAERAIVFGLGHVARRLGPLLDSLGFTVIVCDDGETGATGEPPTWASRLVESFDPAEVERALGGFTTDDHVLIVTRDHAIDQKLLEALIARDELGYLGMIGSRGKVGRFRKRLEARGLLEGEAGEARWARLRAPIGLDLGAETPEEIAVAIAAELIARRRRGTAAVGDWSYVRGGAPSGDGHA